MIDVVYCLFLILSSFYFFLLVGLSIQFESLTQTNPLSKSNISKFFFSFNPIREFATWPLMNEDI